jgi:hypothetical protein
MASFNGIEEMFCDTYVSSVEGYLLSISFSPRFLDVETPLAFGIQEFRRIRLGETAVLSPR